MDEMTDDQLSLALAERLEPKPTTTPGDALDRYLLGEAMKSPLGFWRIICDYDHGDVPEWIPMPLATSRDHAATVEARIDQLGLKEKYAHALVEIVLGEYDDYADEWTWFEIATATPRQRMLAALAIAHAQEKEGDDLHNS